MKDKDLSLALRQASLQHLRDHDFLIYFDLFPLFQPFSFFETYRLASEVVRIMTLLSSSEHFKRGYKVIQYYKMNMKFVALAALIIQNSSLALLMRWSFFIPKNSELYIASTAVLLTELIKLTISIICCYILDAKYDFKAFHSILINEVFANYMDWVNLTVPSMLYTLQNNLQYLSISQLSAPVFQLLYQMKIVTTAVFSVIMLSKQISIMQWLAIITLTSGVVLVQLSQSHDNTSTGEMKRNSMIGFLSVLCGSVTSGFAGVYFEMILKNSSTSLWIRNIQLSSIGVITSLVSIP